MAGPTMQMKGIPGASIFLLIVIIIIIGIVAWGVYANFPAIRAWASKFFTIGGPTPEEAEGEFNPLDMLNPSGYQKYAEKMSAMWRPEVTTPTITTTAQPYVAIEFPSAPIIDQPTISNKTLEDYGTGVTVSVKNSGDSDVYDLKISINVVPPQRFFEIFGGELPEADINCEGFPVTGSAVAVTGMQTSCTPACLGTKASCECIGSSCVGCNPGYYCNVDTCTVCSSTCDNTCVGLVDCYNYDPDCDSTGGLGGVCCGDKTCDSGEECSDCSTEAYCSDGKDNNKNGKVDCADSDCFGKTGCTTEVGTFGTIDICKDTFDNDGDTKIDCADTTDCRGATPISPCEASETICTGGFDNDGDGCTDGIDSNCGGKEGVCNDDLDNDCDTLINCADDDCKTQTYCEYPESTKCNDGFDNDGDGKKDCADSDCFGKTGCTTEAICNDAADNDKDGKIDCADSDCFGKTGCTTEVGTFGTIDICKDTFDNDGDTKIDCADDNCKTQTFCTTSEDKTYGTPEVSGCSDKFDNDGDGKIDCADSNCNNIGSCESPNELTCNDEFDNDGDGKIDCVDLTNCNTAPYISPCEGSTETLCSDGFDNNGDGNKDCADSNCFGLTGVCDTEAICNDGKNNDYPVDKLTDCADINCFKKTGCDLEEKGIFGSPPNDVVDICKDTFDNDGDTKVDCADDDCKTQTYCEYPESTKCNDKFDNDADGLIDCADSNCFKKTGCTTETGYCSDTLDNDADGCTDKVDSDCYVSGTTDGTETDCDDRLDGDCDGKIDCADTDCADGTTCGVNKICSSLQCICSTGFYDCSTNANWYYSTGTAPYGCLSLASDCLESCATAGDKDGDGCIDNNIDNPDSDCGGKENICNDGLDNDCDGKIDCADTTNCRGVTPISPCEASETTCNDGFDNDADDLIDCLDSDCNGKGVDPNKCEYGVEKTCTGGFDNDGDGDKDCADSNCFGLTGVCDKELICDDEIDNDGDGCTDKVDSDCYVSGTTDGTETDCDDRLDNDCDTLIDCKDTTNCNPTTGSSPISPCQGSTETTCSDIYDNDGDGKIDCADTTDCNGKPGPTVNGVSGECELTETNCGDSYDNDGDTKIDCDDSDCDNQAVCIGGDFGSKCATDYYCKGQNLECKNKICECKAEFYNCWDNIVGCESIVAPPNCFEDCSTAADDDGDGCTNDIDNDCGGTEKTCDDKEDNDCDGKIDCADGDCENLRCDDYSLCKEGTCELYIISENITIPLIKRGFTKTIRCKVKARNTQAGDALSVYAKVETNFYQRAYQPLLIVNNTYIELLQSIGDPSKINTIATEICRGHSPCSFVNSYGPAKITNLKYLPIIDDVGTTQVEARVQKEVEGKISEILEFLYLVPKNLWSSDPTKFGCEGSAGGGCMCKDSYMDLAKNYLFAVGGNKIYKFDGTSWTESFAVGATEIIHSIELYKNKLFASYALSIPWEGRPLVSYNGLYWSNGTLPYALNLNTISDILYLSGREGMEGINMYDGKTVTLIDLPSEVGYGEMVYSFGSFKNILYTGSTNGVYRLADSTWAILTESPKNVFSFEVYKNMFYAASKINTLYNSSNGLNWGKTEIDKVGTAINDPKSLIIYKDKLYIASDKVYEFDGTSWKKLLNSPDNPLSFVNYGNELYVSTNGGVYSYDSKDWVLKQGSPNGVIDMAVYPGKMKYLIEQETVNLSLQMLEQTKEFKFCLLEKYYNEKDNLKVEEKYTITLNIPVLNNSRFDTYLLPVLTVYKFSKTSSASNIDIAIAGT